MRSLAVTSLNTIKNEHQNHNQSGKSQVDTITITYLEVQTSYPQNVFWEKHLGEYTTIVIVKILGSGDYGLITYISYRFQKILMSSDQIEIHKT